MRWLTLFVIAVFAAALVLAQSALPRVVQDHLSALESAGALKAVFTVQSPGEAPATYRLEYSKPNFLKLQGPDGFTLSDGESVYAYSKKTNAYTQEPFAQAALARVAQNGEVWAWAAFFVKDTAKSIRSAKTLGQRTIKGSQVTEVEVVLGGDRQGAEKLYVDAKLGIARGFTFHDGEKELLAMASEIEVLEQPLPESDFEWKAPEGSKKVESLKPAVTFQQVKAILNQNCMPCHNAEMESANVNFTTYQRVMMVVVAGNPENSRIIIELQSGRMPKGRAPLPRETIETIKRWIADGAKPN